MPTKAPALSPEARRIRAAGQRMYGVRWLRPMAAAMGVTHAYLSLIMSGKRPVTADLKDRIPQAFEHRRKEIEQAQADLDLAIREYRND